jgi:hypothetical protein
MQAVNTYTRLTHGYRDGWGYLDADEYFATVKLTAPKVTVAAGGYDEGPTYVQYARAPTGVDMQQLKQALRDTMGGSNCRHDYDCCGCASRMVDVKHLGNRRILVRTSVSYNY